MEKNMSQLELTNKPRNHENNEIFLTEFNQED
jgi:hypothetical protein